MEQLTDALHVVRLRERLDRFPTDRRRSLRVAAGHSLRVAARLAGDVSSETLRGWEIGVEPSPALVGPYVEYLEALDASAVGGRHQQATAS